MAFLRFGQFNFWRDKGVNFKMINQQTFSTCFSSLH